VPVASALEEEIEADDDERAGDGYAEADDELCALAVAAAVLGCEPTGANAAAGGACCRRAAKQGGNLPVFSRQLGALITGGRAIRLLQLTALRGMIIGAHQAVTLRSGAFPRGVGKCSVRLQSRKLMVFERPVSDCNSNSLRHDVTGIPSHYVSPNAECRV